MPSRATTLHVGFEFFQFVNHEEKTTRAKGRTERAAETVKGGVDAGVRSWSAGTWTVIWCCWRHCTNAGNVFAKSCWVSPCIVGTRQSMLVGTLSKDTDAVVVCYSALGLRVCSNASPSLMYPTTDIPPSSHTSVTDQRYSIHKEKKLSP